MLSDNEDNDEDVDLEWVIERYGLDSQMQDDDEENENENEKWRRKREKTRRKNAKYVGAWYKQNE